MQELLAIIATATTFDMYTAGNIYYVPGLCRALNLQWWKKSAVKSLHSPWGKQAEKNKISK